MNSGSRINSSCYALPLLGLLVWPIFWLMCIILKGVLVSVQEERQVPPMAEKNSTNYPLGGLKVIKHDKVPTMGALQNTRITTLQIVFF